MYTICSLFAICSFADTGQAGRQLSLCRIKKILEPSARGETDGWSEEQPKDMADQKDSLAIAHERHKSHLTSQLRKAGSELSGGIRGDFRWGQFLISSTRLSLTLKRSRR